MLLRIPIIGAAGVNKDLAQHELPPGVFTDVRNIRFLDAAMWQSYGHAATYGTPTVTPYHIQPVYVGGKRYWIYSSLAKIYAVEETSGTVTHTDLTRTTGGDYSGVANKWTSCVIGGIPIFNAGNTTDPPQFWDLNIANNMDALTNWPANSYCKSMRAYKNFLVALAPTLSGTTYDFMIYISQPAEPGAVPTSWDETDATKDVVQFDLAAGQDIIVDGLQLRDSFVVYKENSVWRIDFTGGAYVHKSQQVLGTSGAMALNCIVEIDGFHVVLTGNDVVIHDGLQATSILDKQTRRWLFSNIDSENRDKCFVFKNMYLNEVFICYPEVGESIPNKAMVWNYVDKTVSFRDIPDIHHADYGTVSLGASTTFDSKTLPFDSYLDSFNSPGFTPDNARVLMGADGGELFLLDAVSTFDGSIPTAYAERRGLHFDEPEQVKLITGLRPRISGTDGETVTLNVGYSDTVEGDPTYGDAVTFTIGETLKCDFLVSGRYISWRIDSGTAYTWKMDSIDIEYEFQGMY